mgnify:CR=1 FL=1
MKDEINSWVNEKTNGLIPELFADDLSAYTNILINTLYMKCAWLNTFSEHMTKEDDFTTIDGDVVKKEMMKIKKKFVKTDGVLAWHAYQSFKEGEVTPDEAHKIGLELAKEMWGDRFEVIVSTHLNTNHYHNHFVINSVSLNSFLSNSFSGSITTSSVSKCPPSKSDTPLCLASKK